MFIRACMVITAYAIMAPFASLWDYLRDEWWDDIKNVWSAYEETRDDNDSS